MNLPRLGSIAVLATGMLFAQVALSQTDNSGDKTTGQKVTAGTKKAVQSVKSGTKKALSSAEQASDNLRNKVKRVIHGDKAGAKTAQTARNGETVGASKTDTGSPCMKLSDAAQRQQCQGQVS